LKENLLICRKDETPDKVNLVGEKVPYEFTPFDKDFIDTDVGKLASFCEVGRALDMQHLYKYACQSFDASIKVLVFCLFSRKFNKMMGL
jgi:hypothetical protein